MFLRLAIQRLEDGDFLIQGNRFNATVYLLGYAVECALKALILSAMMTTTSQSEMIESFRGNLGHNYDWLKQQYENLRKSRPPRHTNKFPREILERLLRVNSWNTGLRYQTALIDRQVAQMFLQDAKAIVGWVEGRL